MHYSNLNSELDPSYSQFVLAMQAFVYLDIQDPKKAKELMEQALTLVK